MLCFIVYILFSHWKSLRTFVKETPEPYCLLIIYTSMQLFSPLFISGRGIPLPPPTEANNTEDLCRRLEQKIESLTKMGGSLQKENKGNQRWWRVEFYVHYHISCGTFSFKKKWGVNINAYLNSSMA